MWSRQSREAGRPSICDGIVNPRRWMWRRRVQKSLEGKETGKGIISGVVQSVIDGEIERVKQTGKSQRGSYLSVLPCLRVQHSSSSTCFEKTALEGCHVNDENVMREL